jgi:hypothetical protein
MFIKKKNINKKKLDDLKIDKKYISLIKNPFILLMQSFLDFFTIIFIFYG